LGELNMNLKPNNYLYGALKTCRSMKVILLFIFLAGFFQSCTSSLSKEDVLVYDIIHKFAVLERQKNNLEVGGTGSSIPENIEKFFVYFRCYEKMSREQSRILVISCVNDILDLINNDPKIRPYLENYPCTARNIELMFSFVDQNCKHVGPPFIALIFTEEAVIYYRCYDPVQDSFCDSKAETWDEAVRLCSP
jgi:hypothetical protein